MASMLAHQSLALALLVAAVSITGVGSSKKSLNITNSCVHTVWPAISSVASPAALDTTGMELAPGQWEILAVPSGWSGRVWGRTLCSTDSSSGRFTCVTGDCSTGHQDCAGGNAVPPVTLAQFTMDGTGEMDFYDISVVDGYNLPMLVTPPEDAAPAGGNCTPAGCVMDLMNGECPDELRVTSGTGTVACKSACLAFGSAEYCCTGEYGNADACKPSDYSQLFKKACPRAFSYAYDDADSIFTCGGGGRNTCTYTITFCPSTTSAKPSTSSPYLQPPGARNLPHLDGTTTPYTGGSQRVGDGASLAASSPSRIALVVGVLTLVTAALGALAKFLGLFKLCFS